MDNNTTNITTVKTKTPSLRRKRANPDDDDSLLPIWLDQSPHIPQNTARDKLPTRFVSLPDSLDPREYVSQFRATKSPYIIPPNFLLPTTQWPELFQVPNLPELIDKLNTLHNKFFMLNGQDSIYFHGKNVTREARKRMGSLKKYLLLALQKSPTIPLSSIASYYFSYHPNPYITPHFLSIDAIPSSIRKKYSHFSIFRHVIPYFHCFRATTKGSWIGRTLSDVFIHDFKHTAEHVRTICALNRVVINNSIIKDPSRIFSDGDRLFSYGHRHEPPSNAAKELPILYQDDNIVVVDKPRNIVIHPIGVYRSNTLTFLLSKQLQISTIRSIHRLDRQTSGVVMLAKSQHAATCVAQHFFEGKMRKLYFCLVHGRFPSPIAIERNTHSFKTHGPIFLNKFRKTLDQNQNQQPIQEYAANLVDHYASKFHSLVKSRADANTQTFFTEEDVGSIPTQVNSEIATPTKTERSKSFGQPQNPLWFLDEKSQFSAYANSSHVAPKYLIDLSESESGKTGWDSSKTAVTTGFLPELQLISCFEPLSFQSHSIGRPLEFAIEDMAQGQIFARTGNHLVKPYKKQIAEKDENLFDIDRHFGPWPHQFFPTLPKAATTCFRPLWTHCYHPESNSWVSCVLCYPLSGRTHQIRIHLQFLGHPIVGDPLYGDESLDQHYLDHSQPKINIKTPAIPEMPSDPEFLVTESSTSETPLLHKFKYNLNIPTEISNIKTENITLSSQDSICRYCQNPNVQGHLPALSSVIPLHLHAWRYYSVDYPTFDFQTSIPDWAKETKNIE